MHHYKLCGFWIWRWFFSGSVAGIHSAGMDISNKFLKLDLHTVFTYLGYSKPSPWQYMQRYTPENIVWTKYVNTVWRSSFKEYTVVAERVRYFAFSYSLTPAMDWYFVLFNNSFKFWSIIITRDSFGICSSWGFQNCPWKLNLTKICLSQSG